MISKVTEMGVILSTTQGWTDVMDKVNMQTICKNEKPFDLVDAETFDLALEKYIDNQSQDVEDSNSYMIYLKPNNLYPKEDQHISCMYFGEFLFTPPAPVATSQGTLSVSFGTSDMQ